MLNVVPIFGWLLDIGFKISLAIPFWIIWVGFGIGDTYFDFLPAIYRNPGFWDCVGVFIVVPIIYGIFVPTIVSVNQSVEKK